MKIVKVVRKWLIQGKGSGWIFNKKFTAKWKAEAALEVFRKGGRVSDYWKKQSECAPPRREPLKALALVTRALEEIKKLDPTCEEIEEYGKNAVYGELQLQQMKNISSHIYIILGDVNQMGEFISISVTVVII